MLTFGLGLTVTGIAAEVAEQPAAVVTVTVKLPALLTVIDCVVAPLLHNQEFPAEAVRETLFPWQKFVAPFAVINAAGNGLTVTITAAEVLVHVPFVTVTVYEPELFAVYD